MNDQAGREPARDPLDLARLLVARELAGDVDGMAELYEPDAVLDCGGGKLARGRQAIRSSMPVWWRPGANSILAISALPCSAEAWR